MEPVLERPGLSVYQGDALAVLRTLSSESVHACVTSPPYYGLRAYGTEPVVWGGLEGCEHAWQAGIKRGQSGGLASPKVQIKGSDNFQIVPDSDYATCVRCGAWRGELGQEPTPALFVAHLVDVFREVRRVLRSDGTCWIVIGDGFAGTHQTRSAPADFGGREAVWRPEDNRPAASPARPDGAAAEGRER